jgi:hypothetical protein
MTAKLDRNTIAVGESVTLSLSIEGTATAGPPVLPALPNLRATPNVSQSRRINFINGQQSQVATFDYSLVAIIELTRSRQY